MQRSSFLLPSNLWSWIEFSDFIIHNNTYISSGMAALFFSLFHSVNAPMLCVVIHSIFLRHCGAATYLLLLTWQRLSLLSLCFHSLTIWSAVLWCEQSYLYLRLIQCYILSFAIPFYLSIGLIHTLFHLQSEDFPDRFTIHSAKVSFQN